jgi:hypothetical protein
LDYPIIVLAPVAGLAVYCLSQLLICRALPERNPYISLASGLGLGFIAAGVVTLAALVHAQAQWYDAIAHIALNLVTYVALGFGYFNFVNLNIASLRIRVLEELKDSGGQMPVSSLLAQYNTEKVIVLRFERLISGGHLVERDGRYYRGNLRFLLLARFYDGVRTIVFGRRYLAIQSP